MPEGVIAEVRDGFATLDFVDPALKAAGLGRLLKVAGRGAVETVTREGPRRKYRVPEEVAAEAGLLDVVGAGERGDTGAAAALAAVGNAGARPEQPTARNSVFPQTTYSDAVESLLPSTVGLEVASHADPTPQAEVMGGGHVSSTAPTVRALEETPEWPPGAPSEEWRRPELDAKARSVGVPDPESLPNKSAVLDAIKTRES